MLVSDHVVTLNCFTVRTDFFVFPIDFFWGLPPSLYADEVLCAAFRAARTPPYSIRVRQNSQNGETQCKCIKLFFNGTGPQKLSSGAGESLIFMFFIFRKKKCKKNVLEFCENWALVRTRAQLLHFLGARKWASKSSPNANMTSTFSQDEILCSKKIQRVQSCIFFCALSLTCIEIQKFSNCISITFDFAKMVTFSKSVKKHSVFP